MLEKAAEPIFNDLKASAGFANDVADATQKKQTTLSFVTLAGFFSLSEDRVNL